MTGHGQPESGTNTGPANISERILREVFFPAVHQGGAALGNAQAVMPSYNEIDGIPSHANRWLLGDILRGELGFKGAVVSDYWGILDLARAASRRARRHDGRRARARRRRRRRFPGR